MIYSLTKDKKGYAPIRKPWKVSDYILLEFKGADTTGCHAIIVSNGNRHYKEIVDGVAEFPTSLLINSAELSVRDLDHPLDRRWECESIVVNRVGNSVWVYPEGLDLAAELVKAREDIDKLRTEIEAVSKTVNALVKGYDVI